MLLGPEAGERLLGHDPARQLHRIDSDLPVPKSSVHLMLKYKANWVEPDIRKGDLSFELYPEESIADWHRRHGVWVD